jgi:glycosyltransferase involved in cell wall biosynthesis
MRVLWNSNGPHVGSGYGSQTDIFTTFMADENYDVLINAFYGLQGKTLPLRSNLKILPGASQDGWGMESLHIFYDQLKPDAVVCLQDAWVCDPDVLRHVGAIFWTPVDHRPAPPAVVSNLRACKAVWAMSRFGLNMLRDAGITDAWYVPHGIRTDVFTPGDRAAARAKWDLPADGFIVTCVAANKGYPSRKHLPQLLKAWGVFCRRHKDAVLVLHSDPRPKTGYDLYQVLRFYGIPDDNVRLPSLYALQTGAHEPRHLNDLYNAGDVFILPSAGEGFGIPAVEAQASGSPVILTDFTAQSELCGSGWLIDVDPMETEFTLQGAEQAHVTAKQILAALEQAYAARGDESLRTDARAFALQYDAQRVWERYMRPALDAAVAMETPAQRTAARLKLRKEAEWKADAAYLAQHGVLVGEPQEMMIEFMGTASANGAHEKEAVE